MFSFRTALFVVLSLAAPSLHAQSADPLAPGQEWRLIELNGAEFAPRAHFNIAIDNRMAGRAPCNTFLGTVAGDAADFTIGPIASTRMACPDLDLETAFFAALEAANSARLENGNLIMAGPGDVSMVFTPMEE